MMQLPPDRPLNPWNWLLLLPFIGLLCIPFYNFTDPKIFGFPFFYWYQLLWVPVTSGLMYLIYRASNR